MEATRLIIEYLVAGTLTLSAFFLVLVSYVPNKVGDFLATPSAQPTLFQTILDNEVILSTVFIALAYAVGIVAEYVGERLFEKNFDRIKAERMADYISKNKAVLMKSAILKPLIELGEKDVTLKQLTTSIGQLRFFVMNNSSALYGDIATQINRLRLIRVLFLVDVLTGIAVLGQLIRGDVLFWLVILGLIVAVGVVNRMAILSRFHRYCRAIERSCLILLQPQIVHGETQISTPE